MAPAPRFTRLLPRLAALAILGAAALALTAAPSRAAEDKARSISLTGTGTAKARPDTAHITTGVVTEGDTARAALDANTAAMARVVAALKETGLEARDIRTEDFSVHPKYKQQKDGAPAVITGYRVVNSLRITVRRLETLGAILDTVVTLGSNQIGGIEFTIAESQALTDEARKRAMSDAIRKARLYAAAAGASLGEVLTIAEESHVVSPRRTLARTAIAAQAAPVPIEAGEQALQVRVNVTWELE